MEDLLTTLTSFPFTIMGIVNVTPDSFSDGGNYLAPGAAVAHGCMLAEQGALILDIGGESTRPGSLEVDTAVELSRVIPVIQKLRKQTTALISIDTRKALVAQAALDAGASIVNDVSAGSFDPGMAPLVAKRNVPLILMHSRGTPQTMQTNPTYVNVCEEVMQELLERVAALCAAGVNPSKIILDVGLGFAKRFEDNIALIQGLKQFTELPHLVLLGASRKSFIGHLTGREASDRVSGSLAALAAGYSRGVRLFRVHDVKETFDFLSVYSVIA